MGTRVEAVHYARDLCGAGRFRRDIRLVVRSSSATHTLRHRVLYLKLAVGLISLRRRYDLLLLVGRCRGPYCLLRLLNNLGRSLAHWMRLWPVTLWVILSQSVLGASAVCLQLIVTHSSILNGIPMGRDVIFVLTTVDRRS